MYGSNYVWYEKACLWKGLYSVYKGIFFLSFLVILHISR